MLSKFDPFLENTPPIITLLIFTFFILTSCMDIDEESKVGKFGSIETVEYEGHEYIIYNTGVGSSITHKENCKFKDNY